MGREEFELLLEERRQKSKPADWETQKRQWLHAVSELYGQVEGYLTPYLKSNEISVTRQQKELTEQFIGTYSVEQDLIVFGDERIVLDPIGTLIIGSFGRVDARGSAGTAKLVWIPISATHPRVHVSASMTEDDRRKNEQSREEATREFDTESRTWKIVTEPPNITYIELTEETFFDMMVELLGGTTPF